MSFIDNDYERGKFIYESCIETSKRMIKQSGDNQYAKEFWTRSLTNDQKRYQEFLKSSIQLEFDI